MTDQRGHQKGAQQHAEGSHGKKTHDRLIEQLESGPSGEPPRDDGRHKIDGGHRLFEHREQHDEADLNSEKNRLSEDVEKHGHNRADFKVPGQGAS
jgi:hypothetical protein